MKHFLFTLIIAAIGFSACTSDAEPTTEKTVNEPIDSDTAFVKTLTFDSEDGLEMTADQYHIKLDKPVIILCHQAGWSRGEYVEIAVELNKLGFNCIALDQRSGRAINGLTNQTAANAKSEGKGQAFLDAEQDIRAATTKFSADYNQNVIIWGSSYSSSLVLKIAAVNNKVDKVLSFSPGEYLAGVNVATTVKELDKPAFLTSSKNEAAQTKAIFDNIKSADKTQFVPKGAGRHGSSALWSTENDNAEYWVAVKAFLN
jgi:alpha-beta hydrolase superfamily lysophospholipase